MRLDVVTIFPEYLEPLNVSLVGKARARGRLDVHVHDLRTWTYDRHNTVDDTPYGGGPGMVMKTEPWGDALDTVLADGYEAGSREPALIVPTPSGRPFTQELAVHLSERPWLIFTPARYEGIDRRVIDEYATRMPVYEVSIGDYVLAGGEAAVLVVTEAVARLLPGVLGNAESHRDDSFAPGAMANLLEGPVYTKPPQWRGRGIPDVLLSGHHGKIARWRRDEALRRTTAHRPDLIERCDPGSFDKKDREMLSILGWEPDPAGSRTADFGAGPTAWKNRPLLCVRPACAPATGGHDARPDPRDPDPETPRFPLMTCGISEESRRNVSPARLRRRRVAAQRRPAFRPGDTVNVHVRVIEGNRSRVQQFKGVVIRRQGSGVRETFTVRKVSFSVGVERTFPVHTPIVEKIELVTKGDVRRAKLYYLRDLRGKAAKIKEKREN